MNVVLPDPRIPLEDQDPCTLLAQAVFGEARNQAYPGRIAVANTIKNRVGYQGKYGHGWDGVILKPYQFSSFNQNDPNRKKLISPLEHESQLVWINCYQAAHDVYWGDANDNTDGAVFYFSLPLVQPPAHAWGPTWQTVKIGGLTFHRDSGRASVVYDQVMVDADWYFVPQASTGA